MQWIQHLVQIADDIPVSTRHELVGLLESLKAMETKYPALEHVWFHWPEGMPQAEYVEQLDRLAEEVMPAFRAKESEVAAPTGKR